LSGKLGHRLIEELHLEGSLSAPERTAERSRVLFDRLVAEEAAALLGPGQRTELVQLKAQLCAAVESLSTWLVASSLLVIGVEEEVKGSWRGKELAGRLDLLLADEDGREVVVDMKWGASRYTLLLEQGLAVQLAIYSQLRQLSQTSGRWPLSGYFCLGNGKLLTTERSLLTGNDTAAGATALVVERQLSAGRVAVTGVTRSLPLWNGADAPANDGTGYLPFERGSACTYCEYGAICGRSWEECA
jgi:hypothetical protein